jgi:hypothetical protein
MDRHSTCLEAVPEPRVSVATDAADPMGKVERCAPQSCAILSARCWMESAAGAGRRTYGSCTVEGESWRRVAMADDGERARRSEACSLRCKGKSGERRLAGEDAHARLVYHDHGVVLADVVLE